MTHNGKEYEVVSEGLAEVLVPRNIKSIDTEDEKVKARHQKTEGSSTQTVFYNPIQQFNRDLSVLAIRVFAEDQFLVWKAKNERRGEQDGKRGKKRKRHEVPNTSAAGPNIVLPNGVKDHASRSEGEGGAKLVTSGQESDLTTEKDSATDGVEEDPMEVDRVMTNSGEGEVGTGSAAHDEENNSVLPNNEHSKEPLDHNAVPKGPKELAPHKLPLRILDALSATGLRALRYAKEINQVSSVVANDLSPSATAAIKVNVQHNKLSSQIHPITGNALAHMHSVTSQANHRLPDGSVGKYEVIDLDPYGTATPFIDAAVQALADGGLLCVTCTDAGVFASTGYLEKTFSQYGGLPLKGPQSHEGGLRLVLNTVAVSAARYGIAIEPLLSLSIDFYVRVFVRVRRSPSEVKLLAGKTMTVYNCDSGCGAWKTQLMVRTQGKETRLGETMYRFSLAQAPTATPFCSHCGFKTHLAGPMWAGPLHNPYFVQRILDLLPTLDPKVYGTIPRIEGMLSTARDELLLSTFPQPDAASADPLPEPVSTSTSTDQPTPPQPPVKPLARIPPHLSDPHPFFLLPSYLAGILHTVAPSIAALCGALRHLGYRTTRSHTKPGSIRTDAPWSVIWEVMREWIRQKSPLKEGSLKKGSAGWEIMKRGSGAGSEAWQLKTEVEKILKEESDDAGSMKKSLEALLWRLGKQESDIEFRKVAEEADSSDVKEKEPSTTSDQQNPRPTGEQTSMTNTDTNPPPTTTRLKVVFDEKLGREAEQGRKMVRYQMNPRADWGPLKKARGGGGDLGRTKEGVGKEGEMEE